MYALLREVHGYCGLLLLLFIVLYAATGFPLMHGGSLPLEGALQVRDVRLEFEGPAEEADLYAYLARAFDLGGRRQPAEVGEDGTWTLIFQRPGSPVRFEVAPDLQSARMFSRDANLLQRTVQLHHVAGYSGGIAYRLWALAVDLVSVAMIVFAVTGTYLWYTRTTDHRLGWGLLAISWGLMLSASIFFFVAP